MKKPELTWDDEALVRLQKAPFFVRKIAKAKVEKAAMAMGESRVTLALFEKIKKQEMGK